MSGACDDDAGEPSLEPDARVDAAAPFDGGGEGRPDATLDATANVVADAAADTATPPSEVPDAAPVADASLAAGPDASAPGVPTGALDVLFVIDNSGSMASEQLKVAQQLPNLVRVLTSGDRYPGVPDANLPPGAAAKRKFPAVTSLHLGVISTNAGGIDELPSNAQEAIRSCADLGDDGKLLNSTTVAVDGVIATNRSEFVGYDAGQVVLPPRPECDLPGLPTYQQFVAGDNADAVTTAFGCVAALGVRGCPFEQPLESMWKALAPSTGSDALHQFINGGKGQGDRYNEGFLRAEATLAVVLVSDEEDCSISDQGKVMFSLTQEAEDEYGELNLRCFQNADRSELVQPVQRYLDGLKSLKPAHPERIVFAALVGVPQDAVASRQSIRAILEREDMRYAENPQSPGFPTRSCVSDRGDEAYPPRRLLQVADGLADRAVIASICEADYGEAFAALVDKLVSP
ncbi:MAG: hypothetical protein ABW352_00405 [Polyangiales bacterium]